MSADGENFVIGTAAEDIECIFCTLNDATLTVCTMRDDSPECGDFAICDACATALASTLLSKVQRKRGMK